MLTRRAAFLAEDLTPKDGWVKGPIVLGPEMTSLHTERGSDRSAGRAYECGAVISKRFDLAEPPENLVQWLMTAFAYYDETLGSESVYVDGVIPHITERDWSEQRSASLTGAKAERYFLEWCVDNRPEWGQPHDRTGVVGRGYDVEFPDAGLMAEVKGFRGPIEDIRFTEREWDVARESGSKYVLCLVLYLDDPERTTVQTILNPFAMFSESARRNARLQITYSVPGTSLRAVSSDQ